METGRGREDIFLPSAFPQKHAKHPIIKVSKTNRTRLVSFDSTEPKPVAIASKERARERAAASFGDMLLLLFSFLAKGDLSIFKIKEKPKNENRRLLSESFFKIIFIISSNIFQIPIMNSIIELINAACLSEIISEYIYANNIIPDISPQQIRLKSKIPFVEIFIFCAEY